MQNQTKPLSKNPILPYLSRIEDGSTLELYMNHVHDAVLVCIGQSSIEHHINIDMTPVSAQGLIFLEHAGVQFIPWSNDHFESPVIDPYLIFEEDGEFRY